MALSGPQTPSKASISKALRFRLLAGYRST